MEDFIVMEKKEGVALITLNRPDKLNSFNNVMSQQLQHALRDCVLDQQIRAIVLTGSGRAFCAGQDLAEVMPQQGEKLDLGAIVHNAYNPIIRLIRHAEKPILAAVNGTAAGAGANLAFACDMVLAGQSVNFIQSFSKIGLIPDSGGTHTLPRLIGLHRATQLFFMGDKLSAQKAHEWGMVYAVHEDANVLPETMALAKKLAAMPTKGLALTKKALNASYYNSLDEQLSLEEELQREAGYTHDYSEGVLAFIEKRPANYTGS